MLPSVQKLVATIRFREAETAVESGHRHSPEAKGTWECPKYGNYILLLKTERVSESGHRHSVEDGMDSEELRKKKTESNLFLTYSPVNSIIGNI